MHKYANEDVSLGSWLLGLEVEHVDERSMCCGTPPGTFSNKVHILRNFFFCNIIKRISLLCCTQIVIGKQEQEMCVWHLLIGHAAVSVSRWRE